MGITMKRVYIILLSFLYLLVVRYTSSSKVTNVLIDDSISSSVKSTGFLSNVLPQSSNFSITEDLEYVYFTKTDGIYRFDKSDNSIESIYKVDNPDNLIIHDNQIYFLLGEKICKVNLEGKYFSEVLDVDGTISDYDVMSINDFQISGINIVFRSSMVLFCYNLSNGNLYKLCDKANNVIDAYYYKLIGNKVYYIDHAERTGTLYCYDLNTCIVEAIRGQGISMPKDNQVTDFAFINDELIYYKNNPDQICKYSSDTQDITICDYSNTPFSVYSLTEYQNNLYYLTYMEPIAFEGKQIGNIEEYIKVLRDVEDLEIKQYAIIKLDIKNNKAYAVGQFASLTTPIELQFAYGYVFFTTERFKSSSDNER